MRSGWFRCQFPRSGEEKNFCLSRNRTWCFTMLTNLPWVSRQRRPWSYLPLILHSCADNFQNSLYYPHIVICVDIPTYPIRKYKHFGAMCQDEDTELFSHFFLALLHLSEELLKFEIHHDSVFCLVIPWYLGKQLLKDLFEAFTRPF